MTVDVLEEERSVLPAGLERIHEERVLGAVEDAPGGVAEVTEVVRETVDDEGPVLDRASLVPVCGSATDGLSEAEGDETDGAHEREDDGEETNLLAPRTLCLSGVLA